MKEPARLLGVLAVAALMTSGAQGFLVSNVTDGTVLFSDNYENVAPDEAASPTVGTWTTNPEEGGPAVVTDADFCGGAQCLQNPVRGEQIADFGPADNETGDHLQMQLAFKDNGGASYITLGLYADDARILHFQFLDEASPDLGWGGYYDNAGSLVVNGGEAEYLDVVDTDNWNTIVIDYVNGATDFSWSINGGAVETWNVQTPGILDNFNIFGRTAPTLFDDLGGPVELTADFNDDGVIDDLDLTILATNWDQCGKDHSLGDANEDGCVDDLDLTALATEWPAGDLDVSAIPEPATLSLLALGGLALLRRRRL